MNGLPEVIYAFLMMKGYDHEMFNTAIEAQCGAFLRSQCMIVQKDQGKLIDIKQMPAERMMVPMRWIAFIDVDVFPMTGEFPMADEKGTERLENGEEPVKQ
jgi:hypothetical protein